MAESGKTKTPETEEIERLLNRTFPEIEAYRYNSASIRVRIVDERFEGKPASERDAMVDPLLARLPEDTQADITMLLLLAPDEGEGSPRSLLDLEFERPSPSLL